MELIIVIALIVFGLSFGSFLAALTYRLPRGESIRDGRSFCDSCKKKLSWYDNIPLFSYLILNGRSRCCGKKISIRYPITEGVTALSFLAIYNAFLSCFENNILSQNLMCNFSDQGYLTLLVFLFITIIFIGIFAVDFEFQLIPDELTYLVFLVSFIFLLFFSSTELYVPLLAGFGSGLFFLMLNLVTNGKGMGLGDAKLAIPTGFILGWPHTITWGFLSFVLGAAIGVLLIAIGKAKLGRHIAFGPFMILAFFITLLFGQKLLFLFPMLN